MASTLFDGCRVPSGRTSVACSVTRDRALAIHWLANASSPTVSRKCQPSSCQGWDTPLVDPFGIFVRRVVTRAALAITLLGGSALDFRGRGTSAG